MIIAPTVVQRCTEKGKTMELNIEQIIKGLECCADENSCEGKCPYYSNVVTVCSTNLAKDALAIIKEQDERIFKLENRLKECENGYEGTLYLERCKLHDAEQKIEELTKKVGELEEYYAIAKQDNDDTCDLLFKAEDENKELAKKNKELAEENKRLTKRLEKDAKCEYDLCGQIVDLKQEVADWKAFAEQYQKQFEDCADDRTRLTEENERLRAEIDNGAEVCHNCHTKYANKIEKAKADTVRELAEKVNSCFCPDCDYSGYEIREVIDQIAKEMEGICGTTN